MMSSIKVNPQPGAGAEITGVKLNHLSDSEFREIQSVFAEYGLIFFRDQQLSEADHVAFAKRWGDININRFFAAHNDHPEIALVTKEPGQSENIGGDWHTDHSYDHEPALGSILLARELPPTGGDTWFVSMYEAFDRLSDGMKNTLRGLRAVHSAKHVFGTEGGYEMAGDEFGKRIGNATATEQLTNPVHPVVIRHPLSGKEALYVNSAFTLHFEGWTPEESAVLLDFLYKEAVQEDRICRFRWQPGSIAFWDNRATWHNAQNDYPGHRREMHRITIDGCALAESG
jgi:taurine dioxygenase